MTRAFGESLKTIQYAVDSGAPVFAGEPPRTSQGQAEPGVQPAPGGGPARVAAETARGVRDRLHRAPVEDAVARAKASGGVVLLENLRFHAEEEANDPAFAKTLAREADVYVNDAFGAAHRAHASVEGIAHHVKRAGGRPADGARAEAISVKRSMHPARPLVAILGGAKVSDKIDVSSEPARQGRSPDYWRRHGLHVPQVAWPSGGRVARRGRQARRSAHDHGGRGQTWRRADAALPTTS